MLLPYTFNILTHFFIISWQIIHLKNVDVYTFWGGVWKRVSFQHSLKCWQLWTVPKWLLFKWSIIKNNMILSWKCHYLYCILFLADCQLYGRYLNRSDYWIILSSHKIVINHNYIFIFLHVCKMCLFQSQ